VRFSAPDEALKRLLRTWGLFVVRALARYTDYAVPLLRLLADLPDGAGTREEVSKQFLAIRELMDQVHGYLRGSSAFEP
jgi:molybdate-binding protein